MKELIIKQIYPKSKQYNYLLDLIKWLLIYFLSMFIIVCYYIFIFKSILNINNEEIANCITTVEKLKPTEVPNIWYKSFIDDFFSKFTTNSKTIDHKFYEMQLFTKPLIIEHNQDNLKISILDNNKSNYINSMISECEYYKKRTFLLEVQAHYTKMIHNNLINDLHEILKDIDKWRK